jgi:transposase InsO family protein
VKYAWIHEHRGIFKVSAMCRCLGATRQGYYQWRERGIEDEADAVIVNEIRDIMKESRETYGILRVTEELRDRGFHINHKRVERLMKKHNIRAKRVRKRKKTTDSNHKFPASEDRLQRRFDAVSEPNRAWVSDITYLKTRAGWLYLCVWIDLFSRRVVGWSLSSSLASSFVIDSLRAALNRRPGARPLIHSDRGVQYACHEFRRMLWRNKLRQSMSRKGDCWDNSVAESFFGTLKSELQLEPTLAPAEVRRIIFDYIEIFYNRKRRHSSLGYKSPLEVENKYWSLEEVS